MTKQASFVDSSIAYVTLDKLYGAGETAKFLARARQFSADYIKSATNVPEAVRRGWAKQYKFPPRRPARVKSDNGLPAARRALWRCCWASATDSR